MNLILLCIVGFLSTQVIGLNKNWSENVVFASSEIIEPIDIRDIIHTIQRANREERRIKVVGTGHSFNDIADTDGIQMSLRKHFNYIEIDKEAKKVTFGAGVTFLELAEALDENGLALRNVPSHPHINVVGAVVTGTHGSGKQRQALSSSVVGLQIILANGQVKDMKDHYPDFQQYIHSMGALNIITQMTMSVIPSYSIQKCLYQDMSMEPILGGDFHAFERMTSIGDFISFFTDWSSKNWSSVWIGHAVRHQDRDKEENYIHYCHQDLYGGKLVKATEPRPSFDLHADLYVESGSGQWYKKAFLIKPVEATNFSSPQIQTEYFIHQDDLPAVLNKLYAHKAAFNGPLKVSEIRQIATDDIPRSPQNGGYFYRNGKTPETVFGVHFTWAYEPDEVYKSVSVLNKLLKEFQTTPHLGKQFLYDDQEDFENRFTRNKGQANEINDIEVLRNMINKSKKTTFENCFLERYVMQQSEIIGDYYEMIGKKQCKFESHYEDFLREYHSIHFSTDG